MKKTNIAAMALASLALLATSCRSEDALDTSAATGQMTFKATQETPGVTSRTALASDGLTINWVNTDEVAVFDNKMTTATVSAKYTVTPGTTATEATLTGTSIKESTAFVAVSPRNGSYSTNTQAYNSSSVLVTIPDAQTATEGTFNPTAAVMVATATTDDPVFSFKNVCAFLKFTAAKAYTKVEVTAESQISGVVTVNPSDGSVTPVSSPSEAQTKVTLSATSGSSIEENKTYYICVAPGSKISKIDCYTDESKCETYTMTTSTTSPDRNKVYDLGTLGYGISVDKTTIYTGDANNITKVTFANVKNGNQTFTLSASDIVTAYTDETFATAISDNKIPANGIIYLRAVKAGSVTITSGQATKTITVAEGITLEASPATIDVTGKDETSTITYKVCGAATDGGAATLNWKDNEGDEWGSCSSDNASVTNDGGGKYTLTVHNGKEGFCKVTVGTVSVVVTATTSD